MASSFSASTNAATVHGGPDALGVPAHDFSTNGNACGPCPVALAALQAVDAAHYPDPQYTALRETLGRFHGVEAGRIIVAASASEFIFRITAAFASHGGRRVALPPHSYGDYRRAARAWGLTGVTWQDGDHAGGPGPSLHWACDPSSPTGQAEPGLGARIDRLPESATCVLDLAYEPLRLGVRMGKPGVYVLNANGRLPQSDDMPCMAGFGGRAVCGSVALATLVFFLGALAARG